MAAPHSHPCPGIYCRRVLPCNCNYFIPPGDNRFCGPCIASLGYLVTWLHPQVKVQWVQETTSKDGQTFRNCWSVLRLEDCGCPDADEDHPEHWERVGGLFLTFDQAIHQVKTQIEWIGYPLHWRIAAIPQPEPESA